MTSFFDGMPGLLQGFWWVALISSLIFLVQTIATFIGGSHTDVDGVNADFSGDLDSVHAPFQMFSLRNLVNFMLGFGWAGIGFYSAVENKGLLILLAFGIGILFVYLFFIIIKQFLKLSEDNSFKIERLIGKKADVYLTIPAQMKGKGKIQISHKGTYHELPAMTNGGIITTGNLVEITGITNGILIVNKVS